MKKIIIATFLGLLITGLVAVGKTMIGKVRKEHTDEQLVKQVVASISPMLPHEMDGGLLRWTRVTGEHRVLSFYHEFVTFTYDEIDRPKMAETLKKRALERIDQGKNLSQLVLKDIPVEYHYVDKHGKDCIAFRVVRDDLIGYRQRQR